MTLLSFASLIKSIHYQLLGVDLSLLERSCAFIQDYFCNFLLVVGWYLKVMTILSLLMPKTRFRDEDFLVLLPLVISEIHFCHFLDDITEHVIQHHDLMLRHTANVNVVISRLFISLKSVKIDEKLSSFYPCRHTKSVALTVFL